MGDYTEEQVKTWAPDDIYFRNWSAECSCKYTSVAESDGVVAGFSEMDDNSHIDCFYCHMGFQGQGVGRLLYNGIEMEAKERDLKRLFVEASITAKQFFLKMGFSVIKKQTVKIRETEFSNFQMEKYL